MKLAAQRPAVSASISGPPSRLDYAADRVFRLLAQGGTWLVLLLLAAIIWEIGTQAAAAIGRYGAHFPTSTTWDGGRQQVGVLPHICGTTSRSLLTPAV